MSLNVPHKLIANYFLKQTTPSEDEQLREWIAADRKNEELFGTLSENWNKARYTNSPTLPDREYIWSRIQTRIASSIRHRVHYSRRSLIRTASVAALIALIFGYSSRLVTDRLFSQEQAVLFSTESGQRSQMLLPDGTKVWLNANTQLTYSSDYNQHNRTVQLNGEAYFEVTKSEKHPFVVATGAVDVKVLGTTFNVKAPVASPTVRVTLLTGKVSLLASNNGETITTLFPNQQAEVDRRSLTFKTTTCDARIESLWHLNQLFFDDKPAEEVWKTLEGWYGVKFTVENMKEETTYRFTLKTESLTELLTMINQLTPIEYKLSGEEVTLQYK